MYSFCLERKRPFWAHLHTTGPWESARVYECVSRPGSGIEHRLGKNPTLRCNWGYLGAKSRIPDLLETLAVASTWMEPMESSPMLCKRVRALQKHASGDTKLLHTEMKRRAVHSQPHC